MGALGCREKAAQSRERYGGRKGMDDMKGWAGRPDGAHGGYRSNGSYRTDRRYRSCGNARRERAYRSDGACRRRCS